MGRALAVQLASEGANVAICDVNEENMAGTIERCRTVSPGDRRFVAFRCDVAVESELVDFRCRIEQDFDTDHVHLVMNNAGIGGGGSMVTGERATWDRTFDVNWGGVYLGTRVFLPMLLAAESGHLVNTSSVNGFWASLGPRVPHTSYSAAKFAVKGFTEALIQDLRLNAPHVQAHVVMPGYIGTGIAGNTIAAHGRDPATMPEAMERANAFRNNAPTSADAAASVILAAVKAGTWRILVGDDAQLLDQFVRDQPDLAYEPAFLETLQDHGVLRQLLDG